MYCETKAGVNVMLELGAATGAGSFADVWAFEAATPTAKAQVIRRCSFLVFTDGIRVGLARDVPYISRV
jgi:hypothetical protein